MRQGTYEGRCLGRLSHGKSDNGNKQVGLVYQITEGEFAGYQAPWRVTIRQDTPEHRAEDLGRLVETLRVSGWRGERLSALVAGEPEGLGDVGVRLVFQPEYFDRTRKETLRDEELYNFGEENLRACIESGDVEMRFRLRFVNRRMEATMKQPLDGEELDDFCGDVDTFIARGGERAAKSGPRGESANARETPVRREIAGRGESAV